MFYWAVRFYSMEKVFFEEKVLCDGKLSTLYPLCTGTILTTIHHQHTYSPAGRSASLFVYTDITTSACIRRAMAGIGYQRRGTWASGLRLLGLARVARLYSTGNAVVASGGSAALPSRLTSAVCMPDARAASASDDQHVASILTMPLYNFIFKSALYKMLLIIYSSAAFCYVEGWVRVFNIVCVDFTWNKPI